MRRILRTTARGQPISRLIHRVAVFAVAFLFLIPLPVSSRFLSLYGRSSREFLGDLDPKLEPTLAQALHMINSNYVHKKLKSSGGSLSRLLQAELNNQELVTELYLRTLSRFPTDIV